MLTVVKKRKLDHKGDPGPTIDSRIYELEFPDRKIEDYSVDVILENLLDQVGNNDWGASLFDKIIASQNDDNV